MCSHPPRRRWQRFCEIREYFIPDFSSWKNHDSYQEAFQRLISDLKAQGAKPK